MQHRWTLRHVMSVYSYRLLTLEDWVYNAIFKDVSSNETRLYCIVTHEADGAGGRALLPLLRQRQQALAG